MLPISKVIAKLMPVIFSKFTWATARAYQPINI